MDTKHTATPWYTYEQPAPDDERYKVQVIAWKANGATLAVLGGYNPAEQRANAAFIVRACNAHDDLVRELKNAAQELMCFDNGKRWTVSDRLAKINALLAKVGEAA